MRIGRSAALFAVGAMTGVLLTGCGSGGSTAPGVPGPATPARAPTASSGGTDTGPPVTQAEFSAKLRNEPALKGAPPAEVDCLAALYVQYIRPDELRQYVAGTLTLDQFNDPDNPTARQQMQACITPPSGTG